MTDAAITGLVAGLAAQSPEAAVELLLANGDDPLFRPCLGMAASITIQRQGIIAARQWFRDLAESSAPAPFKTANLEVLLSGRGFSTAELGVSTTMKLAQTAAWYAGEPWFSVAAAKDLGTCMGETDPVAGAAVMERFQDEETREGFMDTFLLTWFASDAASLTEWLERNPANSSFDAMVCRLANLLAKDDLDAARKWAARITDPVQKQRLREVFSGTQSN
ncbi:MAG: hypothetical protein EOP86_25215 [Verrucomicrobiaceae bacterium]|nr:MAG: hypothetical protein EOP86_25215 [Verrucomicrobiaceae bacterium]